MISVASAILIVVVGQDVTKVETDNMRQCESIRKIVIELVQEDEPVHAKCFYQEQVNKQGE
jgi:hypothetical protein